MSRVVQLADVKNDNRLITPAAMLRQLADEIDSGERNICKKALVVLVDDGTEPGGAQSFQVGFSMANMSCSTAIAAMECLKATFLAHMGFVRD